jgi:glycosyltransferase involved in cell wall biosynthesis
MPSLPGDGRPLDVIYLLVDIGVTLDNSPVLQSQILDWIQIQSEHGIKVGIVAAVNDPELSSRTFGPVLDAADVPRAFVQTGGFASMMIRSARALRKFRREHGGENVYVRGVWGSVTYTMAFPIKGPRLLYDFRGDIVAESEYRGGGRFRRTILDVMLRFSFRRASAIACVSRGASEVLTDKYGKRQITVIPSCVDIRKTCLDARVRAATREQLGIQPSDIVLVYAGGISGYQQIPEMLLAWNALADEPNVRFLLITNETPSPDGTILDGISMPSGTMVRSNLSRSDVAAHLMASDIGFMLRQDHPLNRVASPLKFAEYLAAGLAVVTSPGLGDVSDLVTEKELGVLVDPDHGEKIVDEIRELVSSIRAEPSRFQNRSSAIAHDLLDWEAYLPVWREFLGMSKSST